MGARTIRGITPSGGGTVPIARVQSAAIVAITGHRIEVEVDCSPGLPAFDIVGLPDAAVREARERVRAAIRNNGFEFPYRRVTVNLAPADLRKAGTLYDLPIAIGILVATEQIGGERVAAFLRNGLTVGELALDGAVRPVHGVLSMAIAARAWGRRTFLLPAANAAEAAVVEGLRAWPAADLPAAIAGLLGERDLGLGSEAGVEAAPAGTPAVGDLADVAGQSGPRRALEIAAAGGHNLLMSGPPGAGKTMLARRLPGILPPFERSEALVATQIHSAAGLLAPGGSLLRARPFRAPHHTISPSAMIGGGNPIRPGEVSLSHSGVLFLDELAEFHRDVLEALRQPLEDGEVNVIRGGRMLTLPAQPTLVAALNPCACGWFGDSRRPCQCTPRAVLRYRNRLSGPLLDRFDLQVPVSRVQFGELRAGGAESSAAVGERVALARQRQLRRQGRGGPRLNARLTGQELRRWCRLDAEGESALEAAFDRHALSARAYARVLRVARTIADLAGSDRILERHVLEAAQLRAWDIDSAHVQRLCGGD